jgi:hypothetical protein
LHMLSFGRDGRLQKCHRAGTVLFPQCRWLWNIILGQKYIRCWTHQPAVGLIKCWNGIGNSPCNTIPILKKHNPWDDFVPALPVLHSLIALIALPSHILAFLSTWPRRPLGPVGFPSLWPCSLDVRWVRTLVENQKDQPCGHAYIVAGWKLVSLRTANLLVLIRFSDTDSK